MTRTYGSPGYSLTVSAGLQEVANADPLAVKSVLDDPRRKRRLWIAFDKGLKSGQIGFVRLYFELLGYVGGQRDLVLAFLSGFGLRSVGDFEQVMDRARATEGMDRHASYRVCLDYVTQYRKDEGLPPLVAAGDAEVKEGEV